MNDQFLDTDLRRAMVAFARLNLQSTDDAEDVVQDTVVTMLESVDRFVLISDPKKYAFGILKHKILDRIRISSKKNHISKDEITDVEFDQLLFDQSDHWRSKVAPSLWVSAEMQTESKQFFQIVDLCISRLPAKNGRVFSMKEFLALETDEICRQLSISKADYWQNMSRARKQLQLCLNEQWFNGDTL